MTDEEAREKALEELKRWTAHTVEPQLSDTDLDGLLDRAKRASTWKASTVYEFGKKVQPTVGNGHWYKCIQGGTSGATEPIWPKRQASTVADGTSDPQLRWEEAGPAYENIYDVRRMVREAGEMMHVRTKSLADMSGPVGDLKASQITANCKEIADRYGSIDIA